MEDKPIDSLFELHKKAEEMWPFKGRAQIISKIQSSLDFIRSHKTGPKIEAMLLKERLAEYEAGLKVMEKKHEGQEPKGGGDNN